MGRSDGKTQKERERETVTISVLLHCTLIANRAYYNKTALRDALLICVTKYTISGIKVMIYVVHANHWQN